MEDRVLLDRIEECTEPIDFVQLSGQGGRKIESKPIHVHLPHPIPQAIHDELKCSWMPYVQGVATACVVHIVARVIGDQAVIGGVVDPAKRQRGPQVIALSRMVVYHIEDHLDPCAVQSFYHGLKFIDVATPVV